MPPKAALGWLEPEQMQARGLECIGVALQGQLEHLDPDPISVTKAEGEHKKWHSLEPLTLETAPAVTL